MSERSVLMQDARARRATREALARQARRRHRTRIGAVIVAVGCVALLVFMASVASGPSVAGSRAPSVRHPPRVHRAPPQNPYGAEPAPASQRVAIKLKLPVSSAILFNVRTGQVMWEHNSGRILPIASLTKMMTALVVVAHARPSARVLVTPQAIHFSGSGIGLLPLGKRVLLETMLYGLLLPSGNDAAIALAQHVAGTQTRFIALMNARAHAMRLRCTHFTTVSGIIDAGNHSCTADLAVIAHAVLEQPVLARIVASRSAVLPFPIKGGKLYLYNNNPLLALEFPGTDGVKTGFTTAAGPCLVAAARRGGQWLGVVLLHSADTSDQAQALLNAGFAVLRSERGPR
jgi:D-alanyl-D-alanine carboxypeptidase (penicillin-binding protein 5/6)